MGKFTMGRTPEHEESTMIVKEPEIVYVDRPIEIHVEKIVEIVKEVLVPVEVVKEVPVEVIHYIDRLVFRFRLPFWATLVMVTETITLIALMIKFVK